MLKAKIIRIYYDKLRPDNTHWRKAIETPGLYLRDYFLKRYPITIQMTNQKRDREALGSFPIDIVYTWVNGRDADFRATLESYLSPARETTCPTRESLRDCRWQTRDELKFSLRSVDKYLPWINRIYIVTNGQALPDWLDTSHPKIEIVTHDQIIPAEYLPTFNSHVIESYLHHIPGLSEHYLYLNDDVMFLRPATQVDFFGNDGTPYIDVAKSALPNGPRQHGEAEAVWAAKNARALVFGTSGYFFDKRFGHLAHPQLKSVAQAAEKKYKAQYDAFRANKFRGEEDIVTCSFLHHAEASLSKGAVFKEMDGWYVRIRDRIALKRYKEMLKQKDTAQARLAVCVNDHVPEGVELADYERHCADFMEKYYPEKSSFEKTAA